MNRAYRELYRRKLPKLLEKLKDIVSRTHDVDFLQLVWAAYELQDGHGADVRRFLNYPPEAADPPRESDYRIHEWELESLLNVLFTTPKHVLQHGYNRWFNCREFGTISEAVNRLRAVENAEAATVLTGENILMEMHRIAHRTFAWQRGFATQERVYRYAFIYGQGDCAAFFVRQHGLSIDGFITICFCLYTDLQRRPWSRPPNLDLLDIDQALLNLTLGIISRPLEDIRKLAEEKIRKMPASLAGRVAFLPGVLREFPIITRSNGRECMAPLPELIMLRSNAGLFYDMLRGSTALLNEAGDRFEQYVVHFMREFYKRFEILPSQKYGPKRHQVDTPDVLIKNRGSIAAVFECKSTKLTFDAQFSDKPMEDAQKQYDQLIKGVTQVWRFFSHARRSIYAADTVAADAIGVILTSESWMQMSGDLQDRAMSEAKKLLKDELDVTDADMRPVVFCSMQDLADVTFTTDEDGLLAILQHAALPRYRGWGMDSIARDIGAKGEQRQSPFKLEDVLPRWKAIVEKENAAA